METQDWITIVIALLSLAAGSGWGKYWLERRHERRTAAAAALHESRMAEKAVLNEFLRPLEWILSQSKRIHALLTQDPMLDGLEYAADNLQKHFASLPDTDSVKLTWKALIDGLIADNSRAVALIQEHAGSILGDDFRDACKEFVYHAKRWEALWRASLGPSPVPDSMWGVDKLKTPSFPESMDALLAKEIEERSRRAGM